MKKDIKGRHPEYYEAILQLRPVKDEILDFINGILKGRNDVHISKVVDLKNGVDIYLDNQRFARGTLAQQLKRKFKGKLIITKTLYGQDRMTSRLLYRATISFRLDKEITEE